MNVGELLGLEEDSELLELARRRWPNWAQAENRLAVVAEYDQLRGYLRAATTAEGDRCLLGLAMLAAPDGGDDIAAAAALAKALLPGATVLASRLTVTLAARRGQSSHLLEPGRESRRVNELVASQLWLEVRGFPWRRLTTVGGNILMQIRAAVLHECGDPVQLERADRTWARTRSCDLPDLDAVAHRDPHDATALYPDPSSPLEELLEVLAWACANRVISAEDRCLLLCLVEEASRTDVRATTRGKGNVCGNTLTAKVAPRLGVSPATVRRRAARTVEALAAAAPGGFLA